MPASGSSRSAPEEFGSASEAQRAAWAWRRYVTAARAVPERTLEIRYEQLVTSREPVADRARRVPRARCRTRWAVALESVRPLGGRWQKRPYPDPAGRGRSGGRRAPERTRLPLRCMNEPRVSAANVSRPSRSRATRDPRGCPRGRGATRAVFSTVAVSSPGHEPARQRQARPSIVSSSRACSSVLKSGWFSKGSRTCRRPGASAVERGVLLLQLEMFLDRLSEQRRTFDRHASPPEAGFARELNPFGASIPCRTSRIDATGFQQQWCDASPAWTRSHRPCSHGVPYWRVSRPRSGAADRPRADTGPRIAMAAARRRGEAGR